MLSGAVLGCSVMAPCQGVSPTLLGSGVHRNASDLLLVMLLCWSSEITAGLGAGLEFLKYSCVCKDRARGEIQGEQAITFC